MNRLNKKTILFAAAGLLVVIGLVAGLCVLLNRRTAFVTLEQAGLGEQTDLMLAAAHGLSALAPENSAAAITLAGENGYAGAQFEARRTADGVWVIMRTEDVRSTTDRRGRVSEMTYKQILQCRLNKGRGAKQYQSALTIPTLSQALSICDKYGMTPVIDVKQSGADCVEGLLRLVGGLQRKTCVLIFAEEEQLNKAKELLENGSFDFRTESVLLCRFTVKLSDKALAEAKQTPDVAVCFPAADNPEEAVRRFADEGLSLVALQVNKPKLAKALYDAGVRRFTTDRLSYQPVLTEEEKEATAE